MTDDEPEEFDATKFMEDLVRNKREAPPPEPEISTLPVPLRDFVPPSDSEVTILPERSSIFFNGYVLLDQEIRRLANKSGSSSGLNPHESRQFHQYVRSLSDLVTLEKMVTADSGLESLADSDLEKLAKKAMEKMKK